MDCFIVVYYIYYNKKYAGETAIKHAYTETNQV